MNTISEIYVENFLKHLIIFIYLLKQDIHIDKVKCDDSSINDLELGYKDNASKLLQKLSQKLDFKYTNLDLKYLSLLLLNYRFEQLPNKKKTNKIIKDLIFNVSESMNVTLEDDEILFEQLQKHIPAMIFRLKFNILVKNPFTDKIKQDYPITYNILLNVVENLLKLKKLNPDEIAFLTLYFQLALEKKKVGHKILVLCKMGIITSEILVNRIKTIISTFDTVEVASITQLSDVDLSKYYLILSTVKIDQDLDNLYYISPLISYEKLTQLLKREKQETILKNKHQSIKKYLKEKLIFLDFEAENKEDFCLKIGTKLTKLKYVKDSFVHNLIQRETLGSTDLAQGLAIPHGKVSDINKTFIALIKLSKKIKWQDYKVDLVIIIGISKTNIKESKLIISNIYEIIQDNHILEKIRKSKTGKEVIEIIYGS